MGYDLTLLPLRNARALSGDVLVYNRLRFAQDYRIFEQIADVDGKSVVTYEGVEAIVKTHSLPPGVTVGIYTDSGIKNTRKNPYGDEMVYTTAGDMRKIVLPKDTAPLNKAIMAYVKALQKDTPIILEWH
jgi:hypothetical protein